MTIKATMNLVFLVTYFLLRFPAEGNRFKETVGRKYSMAKKR
jgi:hypothetical protein